MKCIVFFIQQFRFLFKVLVYLKALFFSLNKNCTDFALLYKRKKKKKIQIWLNFDKVSFTC